MKSKTCKTLMISIGIGIETGLVFAAGIVLAADTIGKVAVQTAAVSFENGIRSAKVRPDQILMRWAPVAAAAGMNLAIWREQYATQLGLMSPGQLLHMDSVTPIANDNAAANYARFTQAFRDAMMQGYVDGKLAKPGTKLGSATNDQVFVAIPPCRIVDSRNAQGPILHGTNRQYYFYNASSSWSWSNDGVQPQGGIAGLANAVCPLTTLNSAGGTLGNSPPSAAVATITAVNTTAAGNFVVWGGAGSAPTASALNWATGEVLADTTVIPAGGRGSGVEDFAVAVNGPSGQADVVVDVVGYFLENQATALDCTTVSNAPGIPVPPGPDTMIPPVGCAAGYQLTAVSCSGGFNLPFAFLIETAGGGIACTFRNTGGAPYMGIVWSRCCRVPGQ